MNKIKNLKIWKRRYVMAAFVVITISGLILSTFAFLTPASAHCDSYQGPVVKAAQHALEQGDVNLILPYVKPDNEAELAEAFNHTMEVRKLGGDAQKLADQYFFETAVRLHRQGEGAAYTGLKDGPVPESIQAADKAMHTEKLDGVSQLLAKEIEHGLAEKYLVVVDARANAEKEGTVEAYREQAEAELMFEKYVYGLFESATSTEVHSEGAEPTH